MCLSIKFPLFPPSSPILAVSLGLGGRREHQRSSRPDEDEGIWVGGPGFLEKDTDKTRAGHYLIRQLILIIMNIGPIDTYIQQIPEKFDPVSQILTDRTPQTS